MTTTFFLVRHGSHDRLGKVLCGRMEGVELSPTGLAEAEAVAKRLAGENLAAVYASPLLRTRQTAASVAARAGLAVAIDEGLNEIDFGAWTGARFDDLAHDPRWKPWCEQRSLHRPPPGDTPGESMGEVQVRAVRAAEAIAGRHPDRSVALVSHADVIKALLCHWLGLGLDFYSRFEVSPASISTVVVGDWGAKVMGLNAGVRP